MHEPPVHAAIMKIRRAPATITLVLIGTATLSGCTDEPASSARDLYRTRTDCLQDWGSDPGKCEPARTGNTHTGYYYGPPYRTGGFYDHGTTSPPRQGSRSIGAEHTSRGGSSSGGTSRGGLGSSASSHSSGGG